MVSATGDLEKSKSTASSLISEYNENKAKMDAKSEINERKIYATVFSYGGSCIWFNKTGEFLTGL